MKLFDFIQFFSNYAKLPIIAPQPTTRKNRKQKINKDAISKPTGGFYFSSNFTANFFRIQAHLKHSSTTEFADWISH
jgi:hypothetical protein